MPKASVLQASFSSGEISPLFYGQADNPRYKKGLKTATNFLPLLQGPVIRRPGTKFCALTKSAINAPILIPFQFSETQAYILEVGNQYIRFYANNGQIVTSGTTHILTGLTYSSAIYNDPFRGILGYFYATRANSTLQQNESAIISDVSVGTGVILELPSPYITPDLAQIRWVQNGDTLYLVHPNYPIYKLQRQGQTYWELFPVSLKDGPYFALNTYQNTGDCVNFQLYISASVAFAAGGFNLTVSTNPVNVSGAITDPGGSGQIQITTAAAHGLFTGQNVFIKGVTGTTEANNWELANPGAPTAYWTIKVTSATTFLLIGSVFVNPYVAGGQSFPALFALAAEAFRKTIALGIPTLPPDAGRLVSLIITGVRYYAYLTNVINAGNYSAASLTAIPTPTIATGWYLGVYSPGMGFPTCAAFHQNRLVFGGPGGAPQEVDGSVVGEYENFAASDPTTLNVSDKNAYSFRLNSSDSNVLNWMASTAQGLLAGTYVAEWVMTPSSGGEALTPTNFNAQQSSFFGGISAGTVQIGNGTLYIQRASRKVREMSFFFAAGTFRSIDLTELSEHITLPKVVQLVVTKESQPLIWGINADGSVISMIYNRDDQTLIAGWSKHVLGGSSDSSGSAPKVFSIASIPAPDLSFDQLWLVVKRYINGSTVYTIEYMTKIFDDSFLQEDAFQLDCGGTFYNPVNITNITVANPCVVTALGPTASFSGFSNGDHIRIVSVNGLNKSTTDANGNVTTTNLVNYQDFVVANVVNSVIGPSTQSVFDLHDYSGNPVSSLTFGSYVFGGQVSKLVTTISGLTWLKNETLSVLADGGIHPPVVVDGAGNVTLAFPASKVQLGYGFVSKAQLLRPDAGSPDGTAIGKTRRTTRTAVQLHRTGDLSLGTSFNNLIPVQLMQADVDQADQPMPLFSGMIREGLESAYDFESQTCFQMSSALPGCIQSITSFMEEFDV